MVATVSGTAGAQESARPQTVLVVPFENISAAPGDDWLTEGIAETVTSDLHQFPALTVVTHESVVGGGLEEAMARDLARKLGATWIVAGGFQRLGSQLRITARIVNVDTGVAIATLKVDGETDDLFALQDRVVQGLGEGFATVAETPADEPVSLDRLDSEPLALAEEEEDRSRPAPRRRQGGTLGPAGPSRRPAAIPPPVQHPETGQSVGEGTGLVMEHDSSRVGLAAGFAVGAGVLTGRPTISPPRIHEAPTLDGRLDDLAWQDAAVITEFVQRQPLDGAPATEATEVYVAYDSNNIYIGVYAHYSDPTMIRANRADRDRPIADDTFLVYFDPFLDQQRAYMFGVNAYGVQSDAILNSGPGGGRRGGGGGRGGNFQTGSGGFGPGRGGPGGAPRGDDSWDALYDSAGQRVDDGFVVEMAIPFKSLRYPQRRGDTPHRWGFQIARTIRGKDESIVWSPVARDVAGFLTQMGVLEGMTGLSTSRNIEILPTFTAVQFGSIDTQTRDFAEKDPDPEGGVNFKYGVTSNLTADLTYNPDFSQIESDQPQIEVNQRFALFYSELRPFFLEGAEIFNFRGPVNLVHTRTIVNPRYGAKLTGKAGNTTIGVMYANDEAAGGSLDDPTDRTLGKAAQTFVGRVRYDLYSESSVGAIYTDRQFLDSHNKVAGIDANFRMGNTHSFGIRAAGSEDRDLDGVETTGHLFNANFRKAGRNLSYNLAWYDLSPDFNTEVGFLARTDQRWVFSNVSYLWWPESWLISWGPNFTYTRGYNFDGVFEDETASTSIQFQFAKNIRTNLNVNAIMERFGGVDFQKTRFNSFTTVSTDRRYAFGFGYSQGDQIFFDDENPYLGFDRGLTVFINARVFPRLQSNINVNTNTFSDPRNGDSPVFDVNIFRGLTTYQFTDRFLLRNITEFNTFDRTFGLNFLFTYRVNAGTVFYVGYDDRYQQADHIERDLDGDGIDDRLFQTTATKRTNRAVFLKLQYLFRY